VVDNDQPRPGGAPDNRFNVVNANRAGIDDLDRRSPVLFQHALGNARWQRFH